MKQRVQFRYALMMSGGLSVATVDGAVRKLLSFAGS